MADVTEVTVSATGTGTPVTTEQATPTTEQATPDATGQSERMFKQSEVEALIRDRIAKANSKADEAARKATEAAERKAAEEQGKFQELYQRTLTELETERTQRRVTELTMLKRDIGSKFGLPTALVDRLQGEDEESITADAKTLSQALPKAAAPNINSAATTPASAKSSLPDDVIREKAIRYGVSPELFKQNYRPIGGQ